MFILHADCRVRSNGNASTDAKVTTGDSRTLKDDEKNKFQLLAEVLKLKECSLGKLGLTQLPLNDHNINQLNQCVKFLQKSTKRQDFQNIWQYFLNRHKDKREYYHCKFFSKLGGGFSRTQKLQAAKNAMEKMLNPSDDKTPIDAASQQGKLGRIINQKENMIHHEAKATFRA